MYNPISTVNITLQASGITAAGFGTPLFITDAADTSPFGAEVRVKTYTSIEEVGEDFTPTDAAYIAAQGVFSNSPSVPQIKIGWRDSGTAAETITEALVAIENEDNDFYFVMAETHTTEEIEELADAIEARTKFYVFSYGSADALTVFDEGVNTDALAIAKENNYSRTKGFFHHDADTDFPEAVLVGYNAPFLAGSVSWANLQLAVSPSQDPDTSKPLTTTQKTYLENRNAGYTERLSGQTVIYRNGLTANGVNYIDDVRGRDSLEEDLNVALQGLLLRQKGGKLPYDNSGITQIYNVVDNVLNRYSSNPRNYINDNYTMNFLMRNDVPTADLEARVYQSGTFRAELTGGIERVVISGTVSIQL